VGVVTVITSARVSTLCRSVQAFHRWIAERTGGPVPRFEKVEPGDEQIPEAPEQRDLDWAPPFLATRAEEDAGAEPDDA
jgi:hypothetical protein